jgi:hypothetical protein
MTAAQRVKRFRRLFDCSGFIKHKKNTVFMTSTVNLMLFTSAKIRTQTAIACRFEEPKASPMALSDCKSPFVESDRREPFINSVILCDSGKISHRTEM